MHTSKPPHKITYYEIDTAFIPAQHFPAALIDLALSRGMESHKVFKHTRIFYEDIISGSLRITPAQCFQLIQNIQKQRNSHDVSFLLGHRLLPGNFGAASTLCINAIHLQDTLDNLHSLSAILTPLLRPRLVYEESNVVIYWQDTCGAEHNLEFLVEMMFSALTSVSRWLSGAALPWHYYFAYAQPEHIEQYEVNFGRQIHFNAQHNKMVIAREYLFSPWPKASPSAAFIAKQESATLLSYLPAQQGFLVSIYEYLQQHIHLDPSLDQTASDFCMSSASLKRKLQKHHTHFQAQYDAVRKDLALYWMNQEGMSNEQIASRLHFHDAANLRRAFKKWTGLTPMELKLR
jgi:AraC-like DNA-binding protein